MRLNPLSDKYCRNTRSFFLVLPPLHLSLVRLIYSMPKKISDEGNIPNIIREKEQGTEKSRIITTFLAHQTVGISLMRN